MRCKCGKEVEIHTTNILFVDRSRRGPYCTSCCVFDLGMTILELVGAHGIFNADIQFEMNDEAIMTVYVDTDIEYEDGREAPSLLAKMREILGPDHTVDVEQFMIKMRGRK